MHTETPMSDVDRLRAAADVCLTQNIGDPPPFDVALADLLRAMAEDARAVFDAALALADTILEAAGE